MFAGIALFSILINLLMLTGSIFMLEVYDRALPSRSIPTLVGLLVIAGVMYVFLGFLEIIRSRILTRIGAIVEERVATFAYDLLLRLPLTAGRHASHANPLRDADALRAFLASQGPTVFFDLPWVPFYIALCFLFHALIGATVLAGAGVLAAAMIVTEILTRRPSEQAALAGLARHAAAERDRTNAEAVAAMGMTEWLKAAWVDKNRGYTHAQLRASDVVATWGAISRVFRMALQSAVLAVGAFLVIRGEASPGIIIASAVISGRALAPVDLAIANWKGFVAARQAWRRMARLLRFLPPARTPIRLPAPAKAVAVEGIAVVPPGEERAVVQDVSFSLHAGTILGIIGPSAAGKSSLARALAGTWPVARGRVTLDGAAFDQWAAADLGRHIGYVPQDVELMRGTVAENIARFDPHARAEDIIAAARAAAAHDMIVAFQHGYDTEIGEQGTVLSAGQRQRIALARALYRNPFLIVLDEPNANLDTEGEEALVKAIRMAKARGAVVAIITHRPNVLAETDLILAMNRGRPIGFGPRDEILRKLVRRDPAASGPLTVISEAANK